jgi:hypothetical protein
MRVAAYPAQFPWQSMLVRPKVRLLDGPSTREITARLFDDK